MSETVTIHVCGPLLGALPPVSRGCLVGAGAGFTLPVMPQVELLVPEVPQEVPSASIHSWPQGRSPLSEQRMGQKRVGASVEGTGHGLGDSKNPMWAEAGDPAASPAPFVTVTSWLCGQLVPLATCSVPALLPRCQAARGAREGERAHGLPSSPVPSQVPVTQGMFPHLAGRPGSQHCCVDFSL